MRRLSTLLWSGTGVVLVVLAWLGLGRMPPGPSGVRVGDAGRMRELGHYLVPEDRNGAIRGERGADVVEDPFKRGVRMETATVRPPAPTGPPLRVSAILISGDRRVAIIDDALVGPGDVLPGGERVAEIRQDAVVLVLRDGKRQIVRIDRGEGQ